MEAHESKKRLPEPAAKLIIWCAPTLALLLVGVFLRGWIPEDYSVPSFILISIFGIGLVPNQFSIPSFILLLAVGLIFTRIILALRSRRKAVIKAILIAVWLIILGIVGFSSIFLPRTLHFQTKTNAQSQFEARAAAVYPKDYALPLEIEAASSVEYHEVIDIAFIFESDSYTLLCDYSEAEYKEALASLEVRCKFRTEAMGTGRYDVNHAEITIEPYATIGDDRFRVLFPEDGDTFMFYKSCRMIVTNDVKRQIAYIVFTDYDLDYAEDLTAFINDYCGWKYIR